jgi:hypothetical protein
MPALPPEWPGCPKVPGERRPLPDAAAVRLCLVPDSAPPYDDEVPAGTTAMPATVTTRSPATGLPGTDGPGTGRPGPDGPRPGGPGPDGPGPDGPGPGGPGPGGPGPGGPGTGGPGTGRPVGGEGPTPGWQSRFAQVLAETLAGSRPPRQIEPWTTQQAREHIRRLGPRMASVQRPRVRRVITYRPASDVMEMAVVVGFGSRVKALAVRLERSAVSPPAGLGQPGGRWVCTAVEAA